MLKRGVIATAALAYVSPPHDRPHPADVGGDQGARQLVCSIGTDASQLAGVRSTMAKPADWTILPERFGGEPHGAYIRRDDQQWFDLVRWCTTGLIEVEEQGITQANAGETLRTSPSPNARRLLGKPAGGVNDRHDHPAEPLALRLTIAASL